MAEGISKTFDKLMAQRIANEERARRGGGFNTRDFLKQLVPVGLKFATNVTNNILSERLDNYMQKGPALSAMQVARMADENTKAYNLETNAIGTKSERDYYMELVKPQLRATLETTKTKDGQFISKDTRAFDALLRQRAGFIADQLVERRKALGQLINAEPPTEGSYENLVDLASRRARPQTVTNYISSAAKNLLTGKTREDAEIEAMAAFSDFNQPVDPSDGFTEGERAVAINEAMEAFKETRNLVYSIDFGTATAKAKTLGEQFKRDFEAAPRGTTSIAAQTFTFRGQQQTMVVKTVTDANGEPTVTFEPIDFNNTEMMDLVRKDSFDKIIGIANTVFPSDSAGNKAFMQALIGTQKNDAGDVTGSQMPNFDNPTVEDLRRAQMALIQTVNNASNFPVTDKAKETNDLVRAFVTALASTQVEQMFQRNPNLRDGLGGGESEEERKEHEEAVTALSTLLTTTLTPFLKEAGLTITGIDQ